MTYQGIVNATENWINEVIETTTDVDTRKLLMGKLETLKEYKSRLPQEEAAQ